MDVKTTCLGVLATGDATGYEIRKAFEDGPFSHFADGGYGSIYPALTKAEAEELVTCHKQAQEKRPAKKVYAITPKGRMHLMDSLQKEPGEDKFRSNFLFTLYFADYLPASWIEEVFDKRIAEYKVKIDHLSCHPESEAPQQDSGAMLVKDMGLRYYQSMLGIIEEDKHKFIAVALRGEGKSEAKVAE